MAIPVNAYVFDEEMDPADEVDFVAEGGTATKPLLAAGEDINSFTLTIPAESAALGLTLGTGAKVATKIDANRSIRFWLTVDAAYQSNAAFAGAGTKLPVELTVVTTSNPARTRQRTLVVKVAQQ